MSKLMCNAEYQYGKLTYHVKLVQEDKAWDWKNEKDVFGEFYFIEYIEESLPSKNRVGGFDTIDDALKWANSHFGELDWKWVNTPT